MSSYLQQFLWDPLLPAQAGSDCCVLHLCRLVPLNAAAFFNRKISISQKDYHLYFYLAIIFTIIIVDDLTTCFAVVKSRFGKNGESHVEYCVVYCI